MQIPLHIIFSCKFNNIPLHFDVLSIDTDVLVLLLDLVSRGYIDPSTSIILHSGIGRKKKAIDIRERERERIVLNYQKVRDCWDSTISQETIGEENL